MKSSENKKRDIYPVNPYSLVFGKKPVQYISRPVELEKIKNDFESGSQCVYIITGVRGSGKTVLMTEAAGSFAGDEWIVVELNPKRDMLTTLASKLNSENKFAEIFKNAKINLSFFGIGVEIKGVSPITDIEIAISKMLRALERKGKKVLVAVDEVVNTEYMQIFASSFQIFIREGLPLFLLMTGLYENVEDLQNEDNLTFLYRAPKIEIRPLNISFIADNYSEVLKIDRDKALEYAKLTKGYSFAFQVLGHFLWEYGEINKRVMTEYKHYLYEYVYEKIWSELSENDKRVCKALSETEEGKIKNIREILDMDTNNFNPYRKRLIRKGIINGDTYGYINFTLPMFSDFVKDN